MNGRYVVPHLSGARRRRGTDSTEETQIQGSEQAIRHITEQRRGEQSDEKCESVREPLLPKGIGTYAEQKGEDESESNHHSAILTVIPA